MATVITQNNALGSFDLLNAAAQERLQQRIADAGGDSTVVEAQLRGHLERLEQLAAEGDQAAKQSVTSKVREGPWPKQFPILAPIRYREMERKRDQRRLVAQIRHASPIGRERRVARVLQHDLLAAGAGLHAYDLKQPLLPGV
jgi:hypothetical protein